MIDESKILFVSKLSKLEYDQKFYDIGKNELLAKYQYEGIDIDRLLNSHEEQKKTIELTKKLFPKSVFIDTPTFSRKSTINKDLIVSIGGDEHFKYLAHLAEDKLLYSIRADSLKSEGALSQISRHNLELFAKRIRKQDYSILHWTRLQCNINGSSIESPVDCIYIGSKYAYKMSHYFITHHGVTEEQKSSGILVFTGAGSTGWMVSLGGKPFSKIVPEAKFFVREIYHGKKSDSNITKGDIKYGEKIEIKSLMDDVIGCINIDSIFDYQFRRGMSLSLSISDRSLTVLHID